MKWGRGLRGRKEIEVWGVILELNLNTGHVDELDLGRLKTLLCFIDH